MYHLTLGYIPRDYNYSVDAAGFTAGFTYGKILSGSHWRDSAGTISLDFGGMVNYAKIDDQSEGWYGHIKGKYQNFEGHFGPRFRPLPQAAAQQPHPRLLALHLDSTWSGAPASGIAMRTAPWRAPVPMPGSASPGGW